jgi:CBS domain-containing protein
MRRVDFMVGARDFKALKAEQFMQDVVYFYDVNATCEQLAREMTAGGFGSVPILNEEGKVVGIVTEFDLLKPIMEETSLSEIKAGDIMTKNPLTVRAETTAPELIDLLEEGYLIRMPVVDADEKLIGIVARRDIIEGYLKATTQRKGFWP